VRQRPPAQPATPDRPARPSARRSPESAPPAPFQRRRQARRARRHGGNSTATREYRARQPAGWSPSGWICASARAGLRAAWPVALRLKERDFWRRRRFPSDRSTLRTPSQTCPICGYVHRGNRRGDAFQCLHCGHADDADRVAAHNLKARYGDAQIFLWTPKGRVKAILLDRFRARLETCKRDCFCRTQARPWRRRRANNWRNLTPAGAVRKTLVEKRSIQLTLFQETGHATVDFDRHSAC
jgi:hypothetical protein